MDNEDAYEAELIDEFDAPSALLQTHARVPPPVYQPPSQPMVSAQSMGYSSSYTGAHVAAANPSALYPHMLPTETRDPAPQYALPSGNGAGGASLYPRFEEGIRSVLTGTGNKNAGRATALVSGVASNSPMARQHSYPAISDSSFIIKEDRDVSTMLHGASVSVNTSGRDSEVQMPQPGRSYNPASTSNAALPGGVDVCTVGGVPLTKQQSYPIISDSYSVKHQRDALRVQESVVPTVDSARRANDADRPQPRRPDQLEVPTYRQNGDHAPPTVPVQPGFNGSKSIEDEHNAHKLSEDATPVNWRDDEGVKMPNTRRPDQAVNPTGHHVGDHATRTDPAQPEVSEEEMSPVLSDQEFKAKQREIARELTGYQHQLNYIAQALAGDTPHQKEERKRRELERQERDHQRAVAMEHRIQHQIDRAHERDERRAKILSRANRASRSPSPEPRENEANEAQECVT